MIAKFVEERLDDAQRTAVVSAVRHVAGIPSIASSRGQIFEGVAHRALQLGGTFGLWDLQPGPRFIRNVVFEAGGAIIVWRRPEDLAAHRDSRNMLIPGDHVRGGLDGLMRDPQDPDRYAPFDATIARKHNMNLGKLEEVMDMIGRPDETGAAPVSDAESSSVAQRHGSPPTTMNFYWLAFSDKRGEAERRDVPTAGETKGLTVARHLKLGDIHQYAIMISRPSLMDAYRAYIRDEVMAFEEPQPGEPGYEASSEDAIMETPMTIPMTP